MNDKTGVDPPKNPFFFHLTSPHLKSKLLHILDCFSLFLLRPRSVVLSLPHSQDDVCRSCPWRLAVWVAGSSSQTQGCSLCKTACKVFKAYLLDLFRPHLLFALQERAQEVPACPYPVHPLSAEISSCCQSSADAPEHIRGLQARDSVQVFRQTLQCSNQQGGHQAVERDCVTALARMPLPRCRELLRDPQTPVLHRHSRQ